eukprot:scaffold230063_cov18-Prasinocladus_malaysianus.AAC.1
MALFVPRQVILQLSDYYVVKVRFDTKGRHCKGRKDYISTRKLTPLDNAAMLTQGLPAYRPPSDVLFLRKNGTQ